MPKSHFYDPGVLLGNSRKGGDASSAVKEYVKQEIERQARNANLSETDIEN